MDRLCLSDEVLSEYLGGALSGEEKAAVEEHLAECVKCRKTIAEAHEIIKRPDIREVSGGTFLWIRRNLWFLGAVAALIFSFFLPKYFLQFLVMSLLMGGKWIVDSKATKMLIMIHEAWKSGDKEKADRILSRFKHR